MTARDPLGRRTFGCWAAALLWLSGCQAPRAADSDPPQLRFSAIPDQTPERVRSQHVPLMEAVCGAAGLRCAWVDAPTYDGLVESLGRGEVDVAYFGAATFARAHRRSGALPLAMRDIDARFSSVIVVRQGDGARSLADLKGQTFSFGNISSTSGHLMLRERLRGQGVVPENHFDSVGYTANHDTTMAAVAAGRAAAGGVNASIYYQRLIAGDAAAAALRVVWRSEPYVDYVWAARPGLSEGLRRRLANAMLDLRASEPAGREALARQGAQGFVPAYLSDFDEMNRVLASSAPAR